MHTAKGAFQISPCDLEQIQSPMHFRPMKDLHQRIFKQRESLGFQKVFRVETHQGQRVVLKIDTILDRN